MNLISSSQNPLYKQIIKLQKSKQRSQLQLFLVEGIRECKMAIDSDYELVHLCTSKLFNHEMNDICDDSQKVVFENHLFQNMVYRKDVINCVGIFKQKQKHIDQFEINSNSLIIILDGIEKPGNLGSVIRTCDAAKVDLVIITGNNIDLYNPNYIRSSLGACFTVPSIALPIDTCINWLKNNIINTYITHLEAAKNAFECDYTQATALVFGSEAHGVSDEWIYQKFNSILIPQFGKIDSMNLANTVSILIYESLRQRLWNS